MIRLELPFPPSANRLWRYDPKSGKAFCSYEYKAWKTEAVYSLRSQMRQAKYAPHKGKYRLRIELCRPPDGRHRDLDNRIKSLSDALVTARVVRDDRLCEDIHIRWVKNRPPCCVWIDEPEPLTD